MMSVVAIGLLLFYVLNLLNSEFNIVPQMALYINTFGFIMGFYYEEPGSPYWLYYLVLITLFCIISYGRGKEKSLLLSYRTLNNNAKAYKFNKPFFWIIVFFIVYHYAVGGIPILSSTIQTTRFDFTSSGLFGIPGRMMLYGKYYLLFYSLYFFVKSKTIKEYERYKKYFYISVCINVLSGFFSGSKSGILALVYLLVYCLAFSNRPYNIKRFLKPKLFIAIGIVVSAGMAYFYYYFKAYNNQFSNMAFFDYFIYRLTNMTVESGLYVLNNREFRIPYYIDFIYYLQKYFKINLLGPSIYPLEIYASNAINHIVFTNAYAYYVPVTVGMIPEFIYHFSFFAFIPIALFGYGYKRALIELKKAKTPFNYSAYGVLIFFLNDFVGKGNLAYHVINYVLVLIMMKGIYVFGNSLMYTIKKKNRGVHYGK